MYERAAYANKSIIEKKFWDWKQDSWDTVISLVTPSLIGGKLLLKKKREREKKKESGQNKLLVNNSNSKRSILPWKCQSFTSSNLKCKYLTFKKNVESQNWSWDHIERCFGFAPGTCNTKSNLSTTGTFGSCWVKFVLSAEDERGESCYYITRNNYKNSICLKFLLSTEDSSRDFFFTSVHKLPVFVVIRMLSFLQQVMVH